MTETKTTSDETPSSRVQTVFQRMDKLLKTQRYDELESVFLTLRTTFFEALVEDLQLAVAFLSITNGPMERELEERTQFVRELCQKVTNAYSEEKAHKEIRIFL